MTASPHHGAPLPAVELILVVQVALAILMYLAAVVSANRRGRTWPWYRSVFWVAGVAAGSAAFVGPLAGIAHQNFTSHAALHALVGMAAPLLLVLAAPFTLALRTLAVVPARRLSRLLRCRPARFFTHPVAAATLGVGGMWVLYLSPLYQLMAQNPLVHWLVTVHFLVSGFLFTVALIPVDPAPHRTSFGLRATVLVASLAAHGILAKLLYAYPPAGVGRADARSGATLMYYAGDMVDLIIIAVLCAQWYRYAGRRRSEPAQPPRRPSKRISGAVG